MAYTTVYNGIVFIEGENKEAQIIKKVKSDLSFKIGAQLKSLNNVKDDLVQKVKSSNGNCLLNFKYGQKSRWLAIDDVAFWGEGNSALLPDEEYQKILKEKE